ncbi:hypothetical protein Anapl_04983 [Anas platyrhynchos]|uniref:Uncharacterized protein n=1 Tax=Anas platyrhynchos TaxID=8839 RepID=R0K3N7_ANAPL|nr:hypothetical protein Anapl_04983 [Anas platyrhynchos]
MSVKAEDTAPSSPASCHRLFVRLLDLYLKGSSLPQLASLGGGKHSALLHLNQLVIELFFSDACPDAEGRRLSTAALPGKHHKEKCNRVVRVSGFCVLQWKDQLAAVGKKAANLPENRKIFSRCQQGCLWPMSDNTGPKAWHKLPHGTRTSPPDAPSRARSPVCWCSHLSPVQTHLEHIMFVMPRQVLPAEVLRNHTVINSSLTCPPPIAKCSVSPRRGRVLCRQPLVPSPPLERRRDNSGDVTNGSEKPSAT